MLGRCRGRWLQRGLLDGATRVVAGKAEREDAGGWVGASRTGEERGLDGGIR
jgi:hypothetical protein